MTKIALITGANKGIGFEIARQLGEKGVTVLMGARDEQRGREAADKLGHTWVGLDVTDEQSIARAAARIEAEHGRLDILVNNAAIAIWDEHTGDPSGTSVEVMRRSFDTNVFGVIAVTNALLPLLRRSDAGRIVNVSSEVGSLGLAVDPETAYYGLISLAYPASKTALNMVTVQYAKELRNTAIKVNAVCPGHCATDLNGHAGFRSAEQGAVVSVRMALLGEDGPTGIFTNDSGPLPW